MFDDNGDPMLLGDIAGELQSEYKLYDKLFNFPQNPAFSRSMMSTNTSRLLSLDAFCRQNGISMSKAMETKQVQLKRKIEHKFWQEGIE